MFDPVDGIVHVLAAQFVVPGPLIGQDGLAAVGQAVVAQVRDEVLEAPLVAVTSSSAARTSAVYAARQWTQTTSSTTATIA